MHFSPCYEQGNGYWYYHAYAKRLLRINRQFLVDQGYAYKAGLWTMLCSKMSRLRCIRARQKNSHRLGYTVQWRGFYDENARTLCPREHILDHRTTGHKAISLCMKQNVNWSGKCKQWGMFRQQIRNENCVLNVAGLENIHPDVSEGILEKLILPSFRV